MSDKNPKPTKTSLKQLENKLFSAFSGVMASLVTNFGLPPESGVAMTGYVYTKLRPENKNGQ